MMSGVVNPIAERVTPEHITDIIAGARHDTDLDYSDRKHSRLVAVLFGSFLLTLVAVLAIVLVLLDSESLLREILLGVGLFSGGFGGGYGVSTLRRQRS